MDRFRTVYANGRLVQATSSSPRKMRRLAGGRGKDATARIDVRLTVQRLTRAARALVATAARHAACLHLRRAMRAAWRRSNTATRAGSAGEPKPGRAGFYLELGGPPPNSPYDSGGLSLI